MENGYFQDHISEAPQTPAPKYGTAERVLAFLFFAAGYFAVKSFTGAGAGLGAFAVSAFMIASAAVYFAVSGVSQRLPHFLYLLMLAGFSTVYIFSDNDFIKGLDALFILFALLFYMYFTSGSGRRGFIDDAFVFDMIKSSLIMPYSSFAMIFPAAFSAKRKNKSGFRVWQAAVGLLIAVIPTVIVGALLAHADSGFYGILKKAGSIFKGNIGEEILRFVFGIPLAMFLFGALYSNAMKKHTGILTPEQEKKVRSAVSVIPAAIAYAAVTPLIILYAVFLSVQAGYYFGGFSASVPDGMTYAEYARSGFFELCAVAVINALVIIVLMAFTRKKEDGRSPVSLRIFAVILSCFTLLLIAVAISKMVLYISGYGLTRLRIYTSWFMILLAFAFLFIIMKQMFSRLNYFACFMTAFVILFGVLCFSDVDGRIAQYNVDAYIAGRLESVDMAELEGLSDSAVPYILKLTGPVEGKRENVNEFVTKKAAEILSERKEGKRENDGVIYFNFPHYRAKKISEPF